MSQCTCSTLPLACELYAEMRICRIPYCLVIQRIADFMSDALSVTISSGHPHRQRISSSMNFAIDTAFSNLRARPSSQLERLSRACTIYLKPRDAGVICMVSMCTTWKSDGVKVTTGGMRASDFNRSWQG